MKITKGLVVRQPWATLIALRIKTIETRPSPPNGPMRPDGVRGLPGLPIERGERIAIVAGKQRHPNYTQIGPFVYCRLPADEGRDSLYTPQGFDHYLPLGSVVCTVEVPDVLPIVGEDGDLNMDRSCVEHRPRNTAAAGLWLWPNPEDLPDDTNPPDITNQLPLGDFTPGRWGWMLDNPEPCEPIPCGRAQGLRSSQGVFRLPEAVTAALGSAALGERG